MPATHSFIIAGFDFDGPFASCLGCKEEPDRSLSQVACSRANVMNMASVQTIKLYHQAELIGIITNVLFATIV